MIIDIQLLYYELVSWNRRMSFIQRNKWYPLYYTLECTGTHWYIDTDCDIVCNNIDYILPVVNSIDRSAYINREYSCINIDDRLTGDMRRSMMDICNTILLHPLVRYRFLGSTTIDSGICYTLQHINVEYQHTYSNTSQSDLPIDMNTVYSLLAHKMYRENEMNRYKDMLDPIYPYIDNISYDSNTLRIYSNTPIRIYGWTHTYDGIYNVSTYTHTDSMSIYRSIVTMDMMKCGYNISMQYPSSYALDTLLVQ